MTYSPNDLDPILEYLLEFNESHTIEYKGRFLIPLGGLQKMLDDFQGYHLAREEPYPTTPEELSDLDKLLELI
jgi:hypothetical protein